MLHQVRHMVGGAMAVARGDMPMAWLEAALSVPARTSMPLAPSQAMPYPLQKQQVQGCRRDWIWNGCRLCAAQNI